MPVDLNEVIRGLREDKEKLERVIASLEELQAPSSSYPNLGSGMRRGRKSMSVEERGEVSQRMKKYWANRRKADRV
jgi:hypothetical protein